ncbi:hypothetical protein N8T08_009590 [Aspergillus melleus]|uniref:Uncharacterized protein n=1 Tax=Aspergillus melleus TaxID=138277 RepID=A0ACC3BD83_9EURO|nr:hypothetical protein N8T08_009590 [Aspergillus melleus]
MKAIIAVPRSALLLRSTRSRPVCLQKARAARSFATEVKHSTAIPEADAKKERVVILGSGWGGYSLSRKLAAQSFAPVVISPRSYFVFTPLLTDAAGGSLDFSNIVEPVRDPHAKVDFIQAAARSVDFQKKTVLCEATVVKSGVTESPRTHENEREAEEGPETTKYQPMQGARDWEKGETFEVPYDKLVVAVGAVSKTFDTPGVRHNAMFFKDIGDARRVKRRVRECFELAVLPTTSTEMRKWLLHFAIVGAGPTGTELAASLRDFIYKDLVRLYPGLQGIPRITLYDVAPKVLSMFDESLSRYAMETMKKEGIDIKTSHHVQGLRWGVPGAEPPYPMDPKRCLTLTTEEEGQMGVGMCVWVTGNAMNKFVRKSLQDLETFPHGSAVIQDGSSSSDTQTWHVKKAPKVGALLVDGHLRVQLESEDGTTAVLQDVFALGDNAMPETGAPPATAQATFQEAKWLAARLNKGDLQQSAPFSFQNMGTMAYIGDAKALMQLPQDNNSKYLPGHLTGRGHICAACRERNIDCVYSPEARKGRPRRKIRQDSSASPAADQTTPSPGITTGAASSQTTLGEDLEQRFNAYFISNPGSRSNLFQNSIASFYRRSGPAPVGPPRRLSYDGLLSLMSHEMVEMLLLRLGHLGCERPESVTNRNAFITGLAADTSASMFEPSQHENPLPALGSQRILQLVDLWYSMHPLSALVSKTLLINRIKDGTVDEALLGFILADASDFYRSRVPSHDAIDPEILFQWATTQLQCRPALPSLSTSQSLILMAWRDLCFGRARRTTCLVGYACRNLSRLYEQWQRHERKDSRKLNGVAISDVELEILQNIYWFCLSTTTWAFMQIDQPFSLFVPDETPAFPCVHETSSALLHLDRASDHISTLPAQTAALRALWPLSQISSTVGHIYTLYLNAPKDAAESTATPWQTRHIHQLHRLLQLRVDFSGLAREIRGILVQAIRAVETEVHTGTSRSQLLVAYHTIVIHMLFPPGAAPSDGYADENENDSGSGTDVFWHSVQAILGVQGIERENNSSIFASTTDSVSIAPFLSLALDTCTRALTHLYHHHHAPANAANQSSNQTQLLLDYITNLHSACLRELASSPSASSYPILRAAKKRLKGISLALQSLGSPPSLPELDLEFPGVGWTPEGFTGGGPGVDKDVGTDTAGFWQGLEIMDPCFFADVPVDATGLLGFPGLMTGGKEVNFDLDFDLVGL